MSAWTIWKFPLPTDTAEFELAMPAAVALTVQVQYGVPVLWAVVLPETASGGERNPRRFVWVGTGQPMPELDGAYANAYRGTVQLMGGDLVLHLFEMIA